MFNNDSTQDIDVPTLPPMNQGAGWGETETMGDCVQYHAGEEGERPPTPPPTICTVEDCTEEATGRGLCKQHGGGKKRTRCTYAGCTSQARKGGVCAKHGARLNKRTCNHPDGCANQAQKGGLCAKHGGRPVCSVQGCGNISVKEGVCYQHGARRAVFVCRNVSCSRQVSLKGRLCAKHGGTRPTCTVDGCTKYPQKGGLCHRHGGKKDAAQSRCCHEGCSRRVQREGACSVHLVHQYANHLEEGS